jgi:hypothetical protein
VDPTSRHVPGIERAVVNYALLAARLPGKIFAHAQRQKLDGLRKFA